MQDFLYLLEVKFSLLGETKNGNKQSFLSFFFFFPKLGSWITLPAKEGIKRRKDFGNRSKVKSPLSFLLVLWPQTIQS